MIAEKLYKHSGQSPLLGLFIAIGTGAILAIFLGFIYNFLIVTIPIVYVNVIISAGFGMILGYGIKFISRFTRIRNDRQNIILAAVVGFIGFYFQWIAYFVFLNYGEHSFQAYQENFDLFYNPAVFVEMLYGLSKVGSWEMFGIPFRDFPLWVIWGLEALLIIGIPILIAYKHPIVPFSENLNRWYPKYVLKNQFESISSQNKFKERLLHNCAETITNLSHGEAFRFSEVSLYYLKDEQGQYISIDNVFIEDRGKGKSVRTPVVHLMRIDTNSADELMEKFGARKVSVLNY